MRVSINTLGYCGCICAGGVVCDNIYISFFANLVLTVNSNKSKKSPKIIT